MEKNLNNGEKSESLEKNEKTIVRLLDINQKFWEGTINKQDELLNVRVHSISNLINRCKRD